MDIDKITKRIINIIKNDYLIDLDALKGYKKECGRINKFSRLQNSRFLFKYSRITEHSMIYVK